MALRVTAESREMAPKRKREDELADGQRDWRNLPRDILLEIHKRLDDKTTNKFALRRIRSVCSSWRSSLLPLTSTNPFPLKLPPPMFLNSADDSSKPFTTAFLSYSDLFLFPPAPGHQESSWIVKVEQRIDSSKWRLENPFLMIPASFEHPNLFRGSFDMFDCNVKEITRSYWLEYGSFDDKHPKKAKAVISWNSDSRDKYDDFTVLVLFHTGRLGLWRPGEAGWSVIPDPFLETFILDDDQHVELSYSDFSDIITFEGKFYATTKETRLIMIDPTTYEVNDVITVEKEWVYKDDPLSYLVECNGCLYLVLKEVYTIFYDPAPPLRVRVFILDANSNNMANQRYCWNAVNSLDDGVFFATDYVTFCISAEDLGWSNGNHVLLPTDVCYALLAQRFFSVDEDLIYDKLDSEGGPWAHYFADCLAVYSLQDSKMGFGREEVDQFAKIFWPPPDWLFKLNFKYFPYLGRKFSVCSAASEIVEVGGQSKKPYSPIIEWPIEWSP